MKNKFDKWYWGSAKWWEFWLPGSGLIGGLILGFVINVFIWIVV